MSNPNREFDKTHLSVDQAEQRGFIHRDYLAHCFRWTHVVKYLGQKQRYQTAEILDIGCGKETPLIKTLYTSKMTPPRYTGVDINNIPLTDIHDKISAKGCDLSIIGNCNFVEENYFDKNSDPAISTVKPFSVITCFEVLEHMHPRHVLPTLKRIHALLQPGGRAFISTPVYNGKAAANHINEMTYHAMRNLLIEAGFCIEARYGTFASQSEYKGRLDYILEAPGANKIFDMMSEYYDSNVMSTIFAPLIPSMSRNVMWVLSTEPNHEGLIDINHHSHQPWSSSEDWSLLFGE